MASKKPLKRSLTGLEIEVQILDKNGYVVPKADLLIKECKKEGVKPVKECAKHMVELNSFPSVKVQNTSLDILNEFEKLLEVAEKNNLVIYPLGMYPGEFNPQIRKKKWYNIQQKILGKDKFKLAGKVAAFQAHYTLPKGVFDRRNKFLKPLIKSKIKRVLIDSYNLAIAIDPAITTLMQSSPFYNGKFLAKDSRIVVYRGGKALKFNGLYSGYQQYGGLPPYKQTLTDLIYTLKRRHQRMKGLLASYGHDEREIGHIGRILDFCWGPVRINKLGTLEQRSTDMNHPKYCIACSVLIKFIQRKVHQEYLRVIPADIGIEESFKVEGNTLLVPPHTYVRKTLQPKGAYDGLEDKEVYDFCKRFLKFARKCVPKRYQPAIKPLVSLFQRKKTVSDIWLGYAKKKGYGKKDRIPNDVCAEFALRSSAQLYEEIENTKKVIQGLE